MKSNILKLLLLQLAIMSIGSQTTLAQQEHRPVPSTLCSSSFYSVNAGMFLDYSIGEMVLIDSWVTPGTTLSQGFLQPYYPVRPVSPPSGSCVLPEVINNVLTPNGDGKNEMLVFRCLDLFPEHILTIYDRAGRIVFKTGNYQNDWKGELNGKPLQEDTYYFVMEAGKGLGKAKGFVSIIRG